MADERNILRDGIVSSLGGVDSGRVATLLDRNTLAFATNVSLRGGFPGTRPRLEKHDLIFDDSEVENWFKNHRMQFSDTFYLLNKSIKVVSVGGRIFTIDNNFNVIDVTPTMAVTTTGFTAPSVDSSVTIPVSDAAKIPVGYPIKVLGNLYVVTAKSSNNLTATNKTDTPAAVIASGSSVTYLDVNSPNSPEAWMEQAEEFFIIQDGLGKAIIFNGAHSRRAGTGEVPTGTAMVYNEEIGRLCVAVHGNQIVIGDVVGGPTSVIQFTETQYLSEGGNFRLPMKFGNIVGLKMIANLDRSNGQGVMIASGERGFSAFNLPPNRGTWKDLTYPVQTNMPLPSATSQASMVQVNGDVFYRSKDGLRSFAYAIREFQTPGNVPVSSELSTVLDSDDKDLLSFASCLLFDNRLLFTVSPLPSANGIYHQGLASLDLDLISRMGQKSPPAYEGVWSGIRPTRMLTEGDRCFIFSLNQSNINELWELHRKPGFDNTESRVVSSIHTCGFDFQNPLMAKKLSSLEIWIDQVVGQVDFLVQWKPDFYPCWFDWGTAQVCVAFEDCPEDDECIPWETFNPGYATRLAFGQPPDVQEDLDFKPARILYTTQIRIVWTGQARIRAVMAKAERVDEVAFPIDGTVFYGGTTKPRKPTKEVVVDYFYITSLTTGAILYMTTDGRTPNAFTGTMITNANGGTEEGGYPANFGDYRIAAILNGVSSDELVFSIP